MALKDDVYSVLVADQIWSIDFFLGGLHVSGAGLTEVAEAIRNEDIAVVVVPGLRDHAEYYPLLDRLALPSSNTHDPLIKGSIVHEAVHALVDKRRATHTTALSNEVAAYMAQYTYVMALGNGGRLTGTNQYDRMVFDAVTNLDSRFSFTTTRGKTLRFQDYAEVRDAIHHHPLYSAFGLRELTPANGLTLQN